MFSQYNKNSKISNIFKFIWILYAVVASFFNSNPWFSLVNLSVFALVTGFVYGISKFYSKINAFLSVTSILIYSLFVDVVCYFVLPNWVHRQSLIQYVTNGFLFNYRYVFLNATVFGVVVLISKIYNNYKEKSIKKIVNFGLQI